MKCCLCIKYVVWGVGRSVVYLSEMRRVLHHSIHTDEVSFLLAHLSLSKPIYYKLAQAHFFSDSSPSLLFLIT